MLEIGFGCGEISRAADPLEGFVSAWLNGVHLHHDGLRRRIQGWIGSRTIRGLAVVLPAWGHAEALYNLIAIARSAYRAGCPCFVIADNDSAGCKTFFPLLEAVCDH